MRRSLFLVAIVGLLAVALAVAGCGDVAGLQVETGSPTASVAAPRRSR